jgi:translation initiation factor IF-1
VSEGTQSKIDDTAEGVVIEALPNALFKVELAGNKEGVLAYLAGKMRLHRIKVLVGDTVTLKLDPYGGRARIVRRS